jgi:hypothetical protein
MKNLFLPTKTMKITWLKPLDIPLLLVFVGVAVLPWLAESSPGGVLVVGSAEGEERYPLDENVTFVVEGPVGETVVRIEDGRAWVEHSDCAGHICEGMGRIDAAGESVVCVPNRVYLTVENETGSRVDEEKSVDAITR